MTSRCHCERQSWLWAIGALFILFGPYAVIASVPREAADKEVEKVVLDVLDKMKTELHGVSSSKLESEVDRLAVPVKKLGKRAVPTLLRALGEGERANVNAVWVLSVLGQDAQEAVPNLIAIAKVKGRSKESVVMRLFVMDALIRIKPPWKEHVRFLVTSLNDVVLRESAASILHKLGPEGKAAVPMLIERVRKGSSPEYVWLLGDIGPAAEDAIPCLLETLRGSVFDVRADSANALGLIGRRPKDVVPALCDALRDQSVSVRLNAARSLARFGKRAEPALPELRKMRGDDNADVAKEANEAIKRIERANK